MKNLEPAVQSFLFQRFLSKAQQNTLLGLVNPPDCFILASYRINAYGTNFDFKEATRLLLETSKKDYDHWPSRAYSYRICKSLDKSFEATEGLISGLHDSALAGSRTALKDLRELDPEKYAAVKNLLRDVLAGVGANFFYPDQMLGGFTYWQWMNTFNDLGIMVQNLGKINRIVDYKVNQRGDGILHLAASSGKHAALSKLLGSFPALGINHVNDKGETPLLCACRAGQVEAVHKILGLGGDASITTPLGESCLHWLVSFEDAHVEEIARALLKAGANVRQCTRKRIAYSIFPASIEVDYERPGTALAWAVHNDRPHIIKVLLEEARDASICVFWLKDVPESPAPMELAAFSHNIECLKLLVEAMKEAKLGFTIGPFLNAATHSADTFSMVLRDGPKFKEKLNSTLDYLVEESRNVVFGSGIGGFGVNLLYKAVSGAHDHVVEYILSPRMDELLGPFDEKDSESYKGAFHPSDINRPCGSTRRTPLLEAVRWNRKHLVDLLLIHGADPKARARHPFAKDDMNWTALHILANAGHDTDVSLASTLVRSDLDVDGQPEEPLTSPREEFVADQQPLTNVPPTRNDSLETPFLVAIQNNAFTLATELLNLGADINAMSVGSGFITLKQPITVLGHLIAASSQYTTARLRYLLHKCSKHNDVDFIIEPARNLSALHRAAWANTGVCHRSPDEPDGKAVSRDEYDMVVNREILVELLQKWNDAEHLDRRCSVDGKTALHLAVEAGNIEAVRLLLERKADRMLRDGHALTPLEYALELHRDEKWAYSRKEMEAVMALLKQ
jgi:ankyrin repeat protein